MRSTARQLGLAGVVLVWLGAPARNAVADGGQLKEQGQPLLAGRLLEAVQLSSRASLEEVERWAHRHGLELQNGRFVVVAEFDRSALDVKPMLMGYGAEVIKSRGQHARIAVPLDQLGRLAAEAGWVRSLREPLRPLELVTSEGVSLTNADGYHANGWTGAGIRVAVIDAGFGSLAEAIAHGELPTDVHVDDFTGTDIGGTTHGTMVAEVVHDMAPESELYLMKIGDDLDLAEAVDSCIARGVRVINHSMCWPNAGPLDGTGPICSIVDAAFAHGIVWVNAAGNHALRHYRAQFMDSDANGWHNFAEGGGIDEFNSLGVVNVGASVGVYLSWNDWWLSDQDYDLFLYYYDTGSGTWVPYDSSTTRQTGSQWPVENLSVVMDRSVEVAVRVRKTNASGSHELTLFTNYYTLEYRHQASSVLVPGDAASALTVGAVPASQWNSGPQAYYSSQGPTYDGRIKPDLMGPTSVSVYTGGGLFSGTSAAAPHVAGSAALLLSRYPGWGPVEVIARLEESVSHDFGEPGKDSVFGAGTVHNDELVPVQLLGLQAVQVGACARVHWETQSETENLGFEVYRAEDGHADRVKLTAELISGAGTTSERHTYTYDDAQVQIGRRYFYWVADVDFRGRRTMHGPVELTVSALPGGYALEQNSPNPFNPTTRITFSLPEEGHVTVKIYDVLGRSVKTLVAEHLRAGVHTVAWDGTDYLGMALPGGIYLCTMQVNSFSASRRMVLVR